MREAVLGLNDQAVVPGVHDTGDIGHEAEIGVWPRPREEWDSNGARWVGAGGEGPIYHGSAHGVSVENGSRQVGVEEHWHALATVRHIYSAERGVVEDLALDGELRLVGDRVGEMRI